ncbi:MAG: LPS assembly lipoprotein LptE [Puniceicoccales bacterium]|jgi:hypothetical protein|nr:LPS assembly lipoprotein LptE [Puniceicoccales bacterium]
MNFFRNSALWIFATAFCCGGCAHYHLGNGRGAPFRSLCVAPIVDCSGEAQFRGVLWQQLRQEIVRSTGFDLSGRDSADASLEVTVRALEQSIATTASFDSLQASSYCIKVTGLFTVRNCKSGEVHLENVPISASIFVPADRSYQDRKWTAIPELTRDLAKQIVAAIAHSW